MQIERDKLVVHALFHAETSSLSYLVWCIQSRHAVIIDPVLDFDPASATTGTDSCRQILSLCEKHHLSVVAILETHAHADHLTAADFLHQQLTAPRLIGKGITQVQSHFNRLFAFAGDNLSRGDDFEVLVDAKSEITVGEQGIQIIETPGHTPACVSYKIGPFLFVGDTLFSPDYGTARCDFPGGDARQLYRSIQQLFSLPDETIVCLCHDYQPGARDLIWRTSLAEQKQKNIHIGQGVTEDEFVSMRQARDQTLAVPKLILPAIQVNIRAGRMPLDPQSGKPCLKLPLNQLG